MKRLSFFAVIFSLFIAIIFRLMFFTNNSNNGYNATSWDAFGYYAYLPGTFIYKDLKKLNWVPPIDSTYQVTGGQLYQAMDLENGNKTFKYLSGVAIMESPFFFIGHFIAKVTGSPADGFSWPYQYAVMWGALFWFLIGLLILRKVLLRYYDDKTTALTILCITLLSNLLQYVAVDGAMSHAYIFPLYSFLLLFTIKWHESFQWKYAFGIGWVIGLAMISRPTEIIMIFIPLLWMLEGDTNLKSKWNSVRRNFWQVGLALLGGIIGILPQLIYWKHTTGKWVFDVGSKWTFHNPWWRVLIGFEKGWFIYTPVAILMFISIFLLKGKSFKRSVLTFCLLNIWIIISWWDWRYGASYSTRALTHSYPVFALALAALISRWQHSKAKLSMYPIIVVLLVINLFQTWQYNKNILHYDHMNAKYYAAIFLDPNPTPLDYSLLDTDEIKPESFKPKHAKNSAHHKLNDSQIAYGSITIDSSDVVNKKWITSHWEIETYSGIHTGNLALYVYNGDSLIKRKTFRLSVPFSKDEKLMNYENHVEIPNGAQRIYWKIESFGELKIKQLELKADLY